VPGGSLITQDIDRQTLQVAYLAQYPQRGREIVHLGLIGGGGAALVATYYLLWWGDAALLGLLIVLGAIAVTAHPPPPRCLHICPPSSDFWWRGSACSHEKSLAGGHCASYRRTSR
jgi:hypothetical protein